MLRRILHGLSTEFLARRTDRARALVAAGRIAEDAGRLDEAARCYRRAAAVAPGHAPAHMNLGVVLAAASDSVGAASAYQRALAIDPIDPYANYNFARLLYSQGSHARAETLLRTALNSKPDFPEALITLSNALDAMARTAEAAEALETALRLAPESAGALFNYGVVLRKLDRLDEAAAALERSVEMAPWNLDALEALSAVLREQGRMPESMAPLRAALARAPGRFDLESRALFALNKDESLAAATVYEQHRDYGIRLERAFPARFEAFLGAPEPGRRLRIGYVSGDFRFHPVAQFLLPTLEHRDPSAVEIHCYATSPTVDPVTERVRTLADHWVESVALTDEQLADMIHRDAIDVLIDLSGHTGMFRLATFALRPAPVQASWLGYLNTTGLTRIHYRLCDARTDPAGVSDALHTERLIRLPHSQWCYRPFLEVESASSPPCVANGYVTFGSFNHAAKISSAMCRRWSEILQRVPDARLVLVGIASERKRVELESSLNSAGVAGERVQVIPKLSLDDYARRYNAVDIALDTFPYGGGTTTFDALWMGVPVVTATGRTPTSRSAASILSLLGLDRWIADGAEAYVDLAVERARDRQSIIALRSSLRNTLRASPLMDEVRFTRDLEAAYRAMWKAWCMR